jgi:cytochrome c oxidase subunit III
MAQATFIASDPLLLEQHWTLPDRGKVGIISLILTETALFTIFISAYLVYAGRNIQGPYPKDVLEIPIFSSICLLSSSLTVYFAEHALEHGNIARFKLWLLATILLGGEFITATAIEWYHLIYKEHLTIASNQFGSTFYSLVGLHGSHVIMGLFFLSLTMIVTLLGFPIQSQFRRFVLLSWYWHFVDGIWVIVFTVVYILGR